MRFRALLLISLIVIVAATSAGGCILGDTRDGSAEIVADIDAALASGPVFIEFGAPWCGWCTKQKPIVEELGGEYPSVTFIDVNVDENGSVSDDYYVSSIPQMNLIVKKEANGSYLYVDATGRTTYDRHASAIVGYTEKPALKTVFDAAVAARG